MKLGQVGVNSNIESLVKLQESQSYLIIVEKKKIMERVVQIAQNNLFSP